MAVRYLSDPELVRLSGWPGEIADVDAVTWLHALGRRSVVAGRFQPPAEPPRRRRPIIDTAVAGLDFRGPRRLPAHGTRSAR